MIKDVLEYISLEEIFIFVYPKLLERPRHLKSELLKYRFILFHMSAQIVWGIKIFIKLKQYLAISLTRLLAGNKTQNHSNYQWNVSFSGWLLI